MIGANNSKTLSKFYSQVLGKEPGWSEGDWFGFEVGSCSLMIGPHSEVVGQNKEPGRIMLHIEADEPQIEFDRIKALGTKVIRELENAMPDQEFKLGTFADPEGNYFQIASVWTEK